MLAAQTTQNIEILQSILQFYSLQEIATLVNILETSDSNLETGRYGPKPGVSRIIQES